MKILNFKSAVNIRDLGGFINKDNKETKYNAFIRSNCIYNIDNDELDYLLKNNITTIIDLRDNDEYTKKESYFKNDNRFSYYNVILKGRKPPKREKDTPVNYMTIIDDKETIYNLFKIILDSNSGVLFNCTAGKDRTGIIAMLILLLANVNDKDIVADYSISDIYLSEILDNMHQRNKKLPKFVGCSKKWYMEETLDLFYSKYKDINNYMKFLGFTDKEINKIKGKII